MAFITDPDDLNQATEVVIDTSGLTISLQASGNLGDAGTRAEDNGVTGQALYSFLKEEWAADSTLIPFPFPMLSITTEQFEFIDDWEPLNDTSRNFIRTAGWREVDAGSVVKREYLGAVTLGTINSGNTAYYFFDSSTSATSFDFDGPVNQGIQTFGDSSNGNFDVRTESLTVAIRVFGNTYGQANTDTDLGITTGTALDYRVRSFAVGEDEDLTITTLRGASSAADLFDDIITTPISPYDQMNIEYLTADETIIGFVAITGDTPAAGDAQFGVVIDADDGTGSAAVPTAEEIYAFVQASLTLTSDINAGTTSVIGQLAEPLLQFVGSDLQTIGQTSNPQTGTAGTGVAIEDYATSDTNRVFFTDNDGDLREFPFVAAGVIAFNSFLQNDSSAVYRMFFTDANGNTFGSSSAILVDKADGTDISGIINGAAEVSWDFDYDNNVQGGRSPGTDADVTIVCIGLATAQYVRAVFTITRAVNQTFSITAAQERNYTGAG